MHLARTLRKTARRLLYLPADLAEALRGLRGDLIPPRGLRDVGAGDFAEVGRRYLGHFRTMCGLEPTARVLDVGCGIGRMAIPLTGYLRPPGSYDGFDIRRSDIDWCTRKITPRFGHFGFQHLDVRNGRYNPDGTLNAANVRFPYPGGSFDLVIASSVFTHLLREAAESYVREIARVLAPGARMFATFFILNDESKALVARGLGRFRFRELAGPCFVHDPEQPESAVGYDEPWLVELLRQSGLEAERPVRYGLWCGRSEHTDYQDIVIARRR